MYRCVREFPHTYTIMLKLNHRGIEKTMIVRLITLLRNKYIDLRTYNRLKKKLPAGVKLIF